MSATITAAERAEISRCNGRRSKGPRTPEGKERSKFNALKHGLDAKTAVLPGEDAETYRGRVAAWTDNFRPRDQFEHFLIEQAVRVSWQLERADRAETARLADQIQTAAADQAQRLDDEAAELGRRLLPDQPEALPLDAQTGGDPDHPAQLVQELESTSAGCWWLLDRWGDLRAILDQGRPWQAHDQRAAIRLLGHQPHEVAEAAVVAAISQACHVLDNDGGDTKARRVLRGIVDRATSRLEAIAEACQQQEAAGAAEQADRLSFDDSDSGERLRRLQMYCGRSFYRMLDVLLKIRSTRTAQPSPVLADPRESVRTPSREPEAGCLTTRRPTPLEPIDSFDPVSPIDILAPAGPVPLDTPPPLGLLAADPIDQPIVGNEPSRTADAVDEPNAWNEPSRAADPVDEPNAGNEPSRGAQEVEERNVGNEPSRVTGQHPRSAQIVRGSLPPIRRESTPAIPRFPHRGEPDTIEDPGSTAHCLLFRDLTSAVTPTALGP
jgi:hypothetical protein